MKKLFWYFKQLFPLVYYTTYTASDNAKYFHIWKMWFGITYNQEKFQVS